MVVRVIVAGGSRRAGLKKRGKMIPGWGGVENTREASLEDQESSGYQSIEEKQGEGSPSPENETQYGTGKENSCARSLKKTYTGKGEKEEALSPEEKWRRKGLAVIGPSSRSESRYQRKMKA